MPNQVQNSDIRRIPSQGRLIALDPGTKRVGVAVSDELQMTAKRLMIIQRRSWKKLLLEIRDLLNEYDAVALIVGLPYNFDGSESPMSQEARNMARKFSLSLEIPVILQDERTTTYQARKNLWDAGKNQKEVKKLVDAEAAAIILDDFLSLDR